MKDLIPILQVIVTTVVLWFIVIYGFIFVGYFYLYMWDTFAKFFA